MTLGIIIVLHCPAARALQGLEILQVLLHPRNLHIGFIYLLLVKSASIALLKKRFSFFESLNFVIYPGVAVIPGVILVAPTPTPSSPIDKAKSLDDGCVDAGYTFVAASNSP